MFFFPVGKETLNQVLQQRKEESLRKYRRFLERKEKLLRKEFEEILEIHMKKYPNPLSSYYTAKLNKCDAELILQKQEILEVISESERSKSYMKYETVTLSDSFDFRSQHPLGHLESVAGDDVFFVEEVIHKSILRVQSIWKYCKTQFFLFYCVFIMSISCSIKFP